MTATLNEARAELNARLVASTLQGAADALEAGAASEMENSLFNPSDRRAHFHAADVLTQFAQAMRRMAALLD